MFILASNKSVPYTFTGGGGMVLFPGSYRSHPKKGKPAPLVPPPPLPLHRYSETKSVRLNGATKTRRLGYLQRQ
jgi:hypothetical protein